MSDDQGHHHVNYLSIFGALCICTALSVVFDWWSPGSKVVLIVLVMGVAIAKAMFVLTYFMHLKFEGNWKFLLLAPTCALALGLPLALLPDVGVHYYTVDVPQVEHLQAPVSEESDDHGKPPVKEH